MSQSNPLEKPTKSLWRSLDELADTPEFRARAAEEFPGFANIYESLGEAELKDGASLDRRGFMKLSAAALALSGVLASGCRRPDLKILPYARKPEEITPGLPNFYATSIPRPGGAFPVIVESHEGRPTKVEGHPELAVSQGATDVHAQASVLDLYSPDRLRYVEQDIDGNLVTGEMDRDQKQVLYTVRKVVDFRNNKRISRVRVEASNWEKFDTFIAGLAKELKAKKEGRLRILSGDIPSPSLRAVRDHLEKEFGAVWHVYEPLAPQAFTEATTRVFGQPLKALYRFDVADRILSLDADFLGTDPNSVWNQRGFAKRRRVDAPDDAANMNRLYVVESAWSITGTMADHRLKLPAALIVDYLIALANKLVDKKLAGPLADAVKLLPKNVQPNVPGYWIDAVADDLIKHQGKALVVAGPTQPVAVQVLTLLINEALGSKDVIEYRPSTALPGASIEELVKAMDTGKVDMLLILDGNPVVNAPADLNFVESFKKVPHRIYAGLFYNETSAVTSGDEEQPSTWRGTWHLPLAHYLECWGDAETADGTYVINQPLIAPLHNSRSALELLIQISNFGGAGNYELAKKKVLDTVFAGPGDNALPKVSGLVFDTFRKRAKIDNDAIPAFRQFVHKGFLPNSAPAPMPVKVAADALTKFDTVVKAALALKGNGIDKDNLEVTFRADYSLLDGRFAYNGWLMEWPDPITKLSWDNAAIISPKTARELGIGLNGDQVKVPHQIVELETEGRKIKIPVFVMPGHPDFSIGLTLGYGPARISHIPSGGGFDVYPLRGIRNAYIGKVKLTPTRETYELISTQDHGSVVREIDKVGVIPEDREIIEEHDAAAVAALAKKKGGKHDPSHDATHTHTHDKDKKSEGDHGADEHAGHHHFGRLEQKKGFQAGYAVAIEARAQEKRRYELDLARPEVLDSQFQWGMVIDLNACTGCSVCMIACQSENNIPIVGREEVRRNREMYWIRLDRYFTTKLTEPYSSDHAHGHGHGDDSKGHDDKKEHAPTDWENPRIVTQPVACVHCEQAPCETVCPVNAAVHSPEGLNLQVYNRCIGTRYCANNCPYKVRRFNWFNFNERQLDKLRVPTFVGDVNAQPNGKSDSLTPKGTPETIRMQKNPDVTVRIRGVMEKCTYCVQRIERGKSGAKIKARSLATVEGYVRPENTPTGKLVYDKVINEAPVKERNSEKVKAAARKAAALALGYDLTVDGKIITPDGLITPACQQACPSQAITFGNVADTTSEVYRLKQLERDYLLLGELNTKPRTSYLPRLRNLNPAMKEGGK